MNIIYLNLNQLSQKLGGRSRSSIYRDVEAQRIPNPIKIGSRLYWIESSIDAYLATNKNACASNEA